MQRTIREPARQTPVVGEHDVAVVGGGIAGVAAAVAAARNGASVCLIEKENALGGLATLGLVVVYLPLCDGVGRQVVGGLGEELLKASIKYGPGDIPGCWQPGGDLEQRKKRRYSLEFAAAAFAISIEELVLESGVKVLYDSRFCGAAVEGGRIRAVLIENKSGRGAVRCSAVVDASGDADVCHAAGERTVSLNTNRRAGWFYSYDGSKLRIRKTAAPLYGPLPEGEPTFAGDDAEQVTQMSIAGREMIVEDLRALNPDGGRGVFPAAIPAIPQFRMTRRLVGRYELDEADEGKFFADSVGMTGDWRKCGPVFCIPYRCLIGARVGNLITAGRCISATTAGWDITRAIPACAVTGQAAGTAAAMCSRGAGSLSDLDVPALQASLKAQGVIIEENYFRRREV